MDIVELGLLKEVPPFFSQIQSPFRLWRYDVGEARHYVTLKEDNSLDMSYLSVTSFCKRSLATSPRLIDWIKKHGDASDYMRDERAAYGTALHVIVAECVRAGEGSWQQIRDTAARMAIESGFPESAMRWQISMQYDVASFFLFLKERVVEIIAMEFPICNREWKLAGTIDFVLRIRHGRGVYCAILDVKSGKKGFWESHELQLLVYQRLWNEMVDQMNLTDFKATHIFNWAPKDWIRTKKKEPGYSLKNQTNSIFRGTLLSRMRIARDEEWAQNPKKLIWFDGEYNLRDFVPERYMREVGFAPATEKTLFSDYEQDSSTDQE